jgi:hypothetical protein
VKNRTLLSPVFVSTAALLLVLGMAVGPMIGRAHAATSISLDNVQTTSGGASASPYQFVISNFDPGTGTDRLLLVGVSANNQYATSVSFGGVSLTQAGFSFVNNDAEFWYLLNPTGSANIVVTMAGSTSAVVGAYGFSGVDQGNPIPTVITQYDTSPGSPSISLTTQYPNSWVLDLPSIWGGVSLASPTCAQEWDINLPGAITGASSSTVAPSPGQVTCAWTASGAGDLSDDVAIELHASAGTSITTSTTTTTTTTSFTSTSTTKTSTTGVVGGITVYAHRIPASYWDPCFATTCSAGSGPGTTMYFELQDAAGNTIQSGYADENGYTFTGLTPGVTYYVYPDDCAGCHGSTHDVVFDHWGDGSTVRPLATSVGSSLDAWYSCTNGCSGV